MAATMEGNNEASAREVRATTVKESDGFWFKGKYRTGGVGISSGPSFISSTTPTISIGLVATGTKESCLPIASALLEKYFSTNAWLTMATLGLDLSSFSVKYRPRTSVACSVVK